ncbi:MAG: hypothetical protein A2268_08390 [Candidatus Raymondbacteria bacterium RifOxyA12_full_50_37]|nr:MAG: hypothetical protein A2268_08390 [Candidatus Raymondbacteria bacterium RifOxyA12_full_50_37]OGJ90351.1 MAG: hypothetical protein A2248_17325 [Candidatus Raymondbacteria bacterium RIFOXYA2_FULL_49_16]OGP43250.1 MAG: hypothetical protein A2324_08155 [Candidatus Raymondbacteria bacterium RIFOXYB2_FULL_49_35]
MEQQDRDLLNELIIESREHLATIEPDLLTLEKERDQTSPELINSIFRAIHSIKGGFGFFGIENIKGLSHAMETVLDRVRTSRLNITGEVMDALFFGIDKLKTLLEDVEGSAAVPIDGELAKLKPFMGESAKRAQNSLPKVEKAVAGTVPGPGAGQDLVAEAVKRGKHLYQIVVSETGKGMGVRIAEWKKMGDLISITPDPAASLENEKEFAVVYASILEPDLIAPALEIPESAIGIIDTKELKEGLATGKKKQEQKSAQAGRQKKGEAAADDGKKGAAEGSDSLRVRVNLLNNLMNLAGELVLSRNQMLQGLNNRLSDIISLDNACAQFERLVRDSFSKIAGQMQKKGLSREQIDTSIAKETAALAQAFKQAFSLRLAEAPMLKPILQNIDRVTTEMQENIMQTRLQPVSVVFNKFPRVVRDLAKDLKKEMRLQISGNDVELDKSIIESLSDPLTHLVRNSVDHGIETPEDREEFGKPREGTIFLRAYHESGKVYIEIEDDGAGIDIQGVRTKAVEKGLVAREDAGSLTDKEVLALIFLPGFSTAAVVSEVSGRGVGMDVVKTNIERLGGAIDIATVFGKGTRMTMQLPLTLAIIPSLIVSVEERRFAIPQISLEELVRIRAMDVDKKIESVHGSAVLRLRGKLLPLVRLADVLGMPRTFADPGTGERVIDRRDRLADRREEALPEPGAGKSRMQRERRESRRNSVKIMVLKAGRDRFGLVVDNVHDNEEIIVKPLSGYLKKCSCYAGSAIMGDGRVAMILDAIGISTTAGLRFSGLDKEADGEREHARRVQLAEQQEMLTFRNGSSELFAIDLSMVARLEKIPARAIERVGDKEYLKYEDRSLRLLRLHHYLPVQPPTESPDDLFVIVPKLVRHTMGIIATHVEDVVEARIAIDRANVSGAGVLGSAIVNNKMIIIIDVYSIFERAEPAIYHESAGAGMFAGKRILLAEDTAFFRTVVENYLRSFGCVLECAKDGDEAWRMLCTAGARYDLLLSDIEMPIMNGLELVRKVREAERFRSMPVVILTSLRSDEFREKSREAGADAYEVKLDKDQLQQTLQRIFTGQR